MSWPLTLLVAAPLGAAAACVLAARSLVVQRVLTAVGLGGALLACATLLPAAARGDVASMQVGGWPPGFAIAFAADAFSLLLLGISAAMGLVCASFAALRGEDRQPFFHPLVLVLSGGLFGAYITADLFNLFVFFEVMLIASYVLLTLAGGRARVRAGAVYVPINLLASTILVSGVALLYGVTGTVNLGHLHAAAASPSAALAAGVIAVAVAVKAAIVPLHGWLPRSYPHATPAVTALFSATLTKAGVYVLYRLYSVVFAGDPSYRPLLLTAAVLTMVVGVLGAVGSTDMRSILAFHMVSQIGYLVLPLGLFGTAAVAAGIFYLLQYIVVKGSLFLSAGAVQTVAGSDDLDQVGGLARSQPLIATGFLIAALALAGVPPLSGFVGKYLLVLSAFQVGQYAAGGFAVLVSLFTLLSMVKIWNGVFWGEPKAGDAARAEAAGIPVPAGGSGPHSDRPAAAEPGSETAASATSRRRAAALAAPVLGLAALTVVFGLRPEGLLALAEAAAAGLVDPSAYVEAVLRP